jgi:hypothetical protein
MQEEDCGDSGCLIYHNPQTKKASHYSPATGPVRVSSVDDFSTQDTYLEHIYLLLQKSRVDYKYTVYK